MDIYINNRLKLIESYHDLFGYLFVKDGLRPAFLIESTRYNPLSIIKMFPTLKLVPFLNSYLVTKKTSNLAIDPNNFTNKQLGDILGYPCSSELNDDKEKEYSVNILVEYKEKTEQIYGFFCSSKTQIKSFVRMIKKYFSELNEKLEDKITMYVKFKKHLTISDVIYYVKENDQIINKNIKDTILSIFVNYGFILLIDYINQIKLFSTQNKSYLINILLICRMNNDFPSNESVKQCILKHSIYTRDSIKLNFNIDIPDEKIHDIMRLWNMAID
jgi:hypothetical protein